MTKFTVKVIKIAGVLALFAFSLAVWAQDEMAIVSGDTVEGQITDDAFEIRYPFSGKAGDVVIIRMESAGQDGGLQTPAFYVLLGDDQLIDSTRIFTLAQTFAYGVVQLPEDGDYVLLATRRDGQSGKSEGNFRLSFNVATRLAADTEISATGTDTSEQYYVIEPSGAFTLWYTKTGGRFTPSISISAIQDNGFSDQVAEMSGRFLDKGTLSITPDSGVLYVARVGKAFLSNSTGDVAYTLSYSASE